MLALASTLLALAGPPPATLQGTPLAVSAWCWRGRCGAPVAGASKTVRVKRGTTVHVRLRFAPTEATVRVAGNRIRTVVHGSDVSWAAARSGGLSISVRGARGWVVYVGRLGVR